MDENELTLLELKVDFNSEVPIYVQVKNHIRMLFERNELEPGTQLPSARELAVKLGINANTVSRIYDDLEREGFLARRKGAGTFAVDPHESEKSDPLGYDLLTETIRQLKALGYSSRQIIEMMAGILGKDGLA